MHMQADMAVLQLMLTPGLGNTMLRRLLLQLAIEQRPLPDFVAAVATENTTRYGIKDSVAQKIAGAADAAATLHQRLCHQQIRIVPLGTPAYPAQLAATLGDTAPPVLFVRGNQAILDRMGVGFCGSRHASEKGLHVAHDTAALLTEQQ
jgi:DNA processing protein